MPVTFRGFRIFFEPSVLNGSQPLADVSTPGHGQGAGPARYELSRSDDEGDCGRGRSERSERSSAGGWTPFRTRVYEKGMTSSHIDFLVILLLE